MCINLTAIHDIDRGHFELTTDILVRRQEYDIGNLWILQGAQLVE